MKSTPHPLQLRDELDETNRRLREHLKAGCHVPGVACITELAEFLHPSIQLVEINTAPTLKEIYPVGGGFFGFGRPAISNFATAGRIKFRDLETRVERGPGVESYTASVTGERFEPDGTLKQEPEEKTYDMVVREEELRINYQEKVEREHSDWPPERKKERVDTLVRRVMVEKRKFARECAITGAKARVVQKLLGLKPAYTLKDLRKPFVILSVTPIVDMRDPAIKKMVTAHALGIDAGLFQSSAGIPDDGEAECIDCSPAPPVDNPEPDPADFPAPEAPKPDVTDLTDRFETLTNFREFPPHHQISAVRGLLDTVGHPSNFSATNVENLGDEEREALYTHLFLVREGYLVEYRR
jgi:hypothetical protein